ncbi:MAG TPA: beta-1,6-N-acetylglucosaminyltransferase [Chitinophagaceae bacterium]|jgi:Core-2/I-Branching enzyme.
MVISYIILAHKEPRQLWRLVGRLNALHTFFYIHVDRNVDITPFKEAIKGYSNVLLLADKKRVASIWGSPGLVKATLNAMEEVIKDNRQGYTILLSGQCYPIKSNACIYSFLNDNYGYNFIEGFRLPDERWPSSLLRMHHYAFFLSSKKEDFITAPSFFDQSFKSLNRSVIKKYLKIFFHFPLKSMVLLKKRRFPEKLKPFGGMQWWALPLETIKFINQFVAENPGYLKYHSFTLFSDEIFFQSIVHNYFDKIKHPTMFSSWPGDDANSSPQTITKDDLGILKERNELFARKFDYEIDSTVLDLIDNMLLHKN